MSGLEELLGWLGMFVFVLFRLVPDGGGGGAGGALEAAILLSCSRSFFPGFFPLFVLTRAGWGAALTPAGGGAAVTRAGGGAAGVRLSMSTVGAGLGLIGGE